MDSSIAKLLPDDTEAAKYFDKVVDRIVCNHLEAAEKLLDAGDGNKAPELGKLEEAFLAVQPFLQKGTCSSSTKSQTATLVDKWREHVASAYSTGLNAGEQETMAAAMQSAEVLDS